MKNEDIETLNQMLIKHSREINNTNIRVYRELLEYYQEHKDTGNTHIIRKLSKIIHLLEVTEDYNNAYKQIDNLTIYLHNRKCGDSYILEGEK